MIKKFIIDVPDFPKKGVLFRDITPVLASPNHFQAAIDEMISRVDLKNIDLIAGIESRGFILGAAIAAKANKGFVPIRKIGKLPPPVESHPYALEYGEGVLEVKQGSGRLLIVDDVLATGGTLGAAIKLSEKAGYVVKDIVVLIDLKYLNDFRWSCGPAKAVVTYN